MREGLTDSLVVFPKERTVPLDNWFCVLDPALMSWTDCYQVFDFFYHLFGWVHSGSPMSRRTDDELPPRSDTGPAPSPSGPRGTCH